MSWLLLSRREWQRRPVRTAITVAGVAISIAALFALLSFERGYREGVRRELDHLGAHILIAPKGCPYDAASLALHGASWPCYLKAKYLEEVRTTPGVVAAAPALMSASFDATGRQVVYVGIDTNMLALRPGWRMDGRFPSARSELLAGSDLAQRQGWRVGQTVELPGLRGATAVVTGVLAPTQAAEDGFMFLPLDSAQALLHHPEELTHILVRLGDPDNVDAVVRQLRGCDAGLYMNIVPLAHVFRTIQDVVRSTRVLFACLATIALLLAGAGVSNTLMMAVAERTREIGVLRALGGSSAQIFRLFWFHIVQVCGAGAILGVAVAFAGARVLDNWLRAQLPFAPAESLIRWDTPLALICFGSAVVLGSVAGLLPSWRAAALSPTAAMSRRGGGL